MAQKKSIWFTYAWEDNKDGDVDFTAQELERSGLEVKLDRWNLTAGKRLWEQIESFIQESDKSDGWLLYATQASLGSEACKEEYAYALDRALHTRGSDFPVIALFPASVDNELIPAGIRTRLFVSLTDPQWKERIVSAVEKRDPNILKEMMKPYDVKIHKLDDKYGGHRNYAIELRPRAGTWAPFIACIPIEEKDKVSPSITHGPSKRLPGGCMLTSTGKGATSDGKFWGVYAGNEATPTQSYYFLCVELPSMLRFGVSGEPPQYQITF